MCKKGRVKQMADYRRANNSISNPLNMERVDNRYCPICGNDTYGHKMSENLYKLQLSLYTGNPCTQVPERKDLSIFMCHSCREKLYKTIKNFIQENKTI